MTEELLGASYFYYAIAEALENKDLYHLYQVCNNLTLSDYAQYAVEVLQFLDDKRLEWELDSLPEDTFLESKYREVDPNHLLLVYKNLGYDLEEGHKPDHLGVELRYLALLCAEADLKNQYRFIHLRLGWLGSLKERLKELSAIGCLSLLKLLESFLRDHKSFLFSQLKQQSQEHQEDGN
ncbi:hypothetical protein [Thermocrinis sp.]